MATRAPSDGPMSDEGYVCPDCRTPLVDLLCAGCTPQYEYSEQFPTLLPTDSRFDKAREIAGTYDSIYSGRSGVWEVRAGRRSPSRWRRERRLS